MSDTKKYYWLKLKRDFFKRHDIKIIESMDNGKDYVLFYLKLLLESVDHNGELRFSETVPYNDKMLATITDTNIDIVRSAVKIFSELGMMERFDDGTLYMEQVNTMLGYETSDAIRMREMREKKAKLLIAHGDSEQCSESFENRSPEKEIELDIEKDKELKKENPGKSYSESFLQFYEQYPKKKGKDQASRTFNGLIRAGVEYDHIIKCLENYKEEIHNKNTGYDYIKFPSSFLNCLSDYEEESYSIPSSLPKTNTVPAADVTCCGQKYSHEIGFCKVCGKSYNRDGSER